MTSPPVGRSSASDPLARGRQLGPSPARLHDLSYAGALAGAAERMQGFTALRDLLLALPAEAAALIEADGTVVLHQSRQVWESLAWQSSTLSPEPSAATGWAAAAARAGLLEQDHVADLHQDPRWHLGGVVDSLPAGERGWRSLLVLDLESPRSHTQSRLIWYAHRPAAFTDQQEVATLFVRHAGLAIRAVDQREQLNHAMEARSRVSQAIGILMVRHQADEQQAFELLRRHSQLQNTKLKVVADHVLFTGELP